MKRSIALICTSLVLSQARAQLGGIFSQKETDLKSVGEQIALLKLYAGWLEKGYRVAEDGLSTIGQLKQGDLSLHANFFSSRSNVNPAIKKFRGVASILTDQLAIMKLLRSLRDIPRLNQGETEFLEQTVTQLINRATDGLNELVALTTDGDLTLSDGERLEQLNHLARTTRQTKIAALHLSQETHLLSANRAGEQADLETRKNLLP